MINLFTQAVTRICLLTAFLLLLMSGLLSGTAASQGTPGPILKLSVEGAIGPATAGYIKSALDSAVDQNAVLVVIQMDTPGGLDSSMRDIIKYITNSPIPVATYVAPSGARAASAGTYILYASHISAMAPGTNLGAATPVQIGGISPTDFKGKETDSNGDAMQHKIMNDAVAYIKGLAQLHGRNQEWAEKAVREAASLQASEALELKVIDIVASSMTDLLQQIDGRVVSVQGKELTLHTAGLTMKEYEMDWRGKLLNVLTDPNVAYILLLIGIYGLIFEFSNPGAVVPGTIGAICLLLALFSFQLLPINYAGMALILLGVALMVGEAFQPSFGILGIGGIIAFVIGSIILMDTEAPGFGIDISIIITFTAISALIFIFVVGMAIKARRRPVVSGLEELIGGEAVALEDFDHTGTVRIHSESWQATTDSPLRKGETVRVTGHKGLVLQVHPMNPISQEEVS